ncbi:alpha/beta fold hydrolase [Dactylosporangium matsuzakiense]|uniref:Alpha/beta hydrolase n=1 Tax=Dactylosporangium matsuzakiense TaxID=53360 RepID=A0A9W6KSY0_9ACTN|nr:alpha/beta fold hydrolase [Dactylosporangium matsuzakiense]GLL05931.1 alpha/beta hydrolase [Dactylosporangium matsuzakiense]
MEAFFRDGMRFTAVDEGAADVGTIVLLHGFPQRSQSWTDTSRHLVAAGYRVIAADQRGYTPQARPRSRRAYRLNELVADVVALLDTAGVDRAHLVGHDWGGGVAWMFAAARPDRLHSLTVVSAPHPRAVVRAMLTSRQLVQAWHVGFFQLPWLPEAAIRWRGGRIAVALLKRSGLSEQMAREYTDRLLGDPGCLAAALRWYRAMPLDMAAGLKTGAITVPTTYVWSTDDIAIGRRAAELTSRWVTGRFDFKVLEGVSHWIPEQAPETLAALILDRARSVR